MSRLAAESLDEALRDHLLGSGPKSSDEIISFGSRVFGADDSQMRDSITRLALQERVGRLHNHRDKWVATQT